MIKVFTRVLMTLGFTAVLYTVSAQQVEAFSLIRENAFTLNPALTGMNGWIHGTATFRKQFTRINQSPYTAVYAMDGQIRDKNVGVGGYLLHDVTGPTGKSTATVSAAYNLPLRKKYSARYTDGSSDHILSFGLALSVVQYRLRADQLEVNDINDPELLTSRATRIFPDASFGLYYRWRDFLYAGVSVPQMLGLNINYSGTDGVAKIRRVQHLNFLMGGRIEWARGDFSIDPVAALRWVKGAPPQGDIGLRFVMYRVFWVGTNYKSVNYMVFEGGFNVKGYFQLSYAYDLNVAPYRRDIGGIHEISLVYRINKSSRVWRGKGPALRF